MLINEVIENKRLKKTGFGNKLAGFPKKEFSGEKVQFVNNVLESANLFILVEEVKTTIHQLIHQTGINPDQDIPVYISEKVSCKYIFLNKLFSQSTGFTIKRYINTQKIELIKEILIYEELKIATIASKLHYRNASHLAEEFRKETGVSPAFYRLLRKTSSYKSKNV